MCVKEGVTRSSGCKLNVEGAIRRLQRPFRLSSGSKPCLVQDSEPSTPNRFVPPAVMYLLARLAALVVAFWGTSVQPSLGAATATTRYRQGAALPNIGASLANTCGMPYFQNGLPSRRRNYGLLQPTADASMRHLLADSLELAKSGEAF